MELGTFGAIISFVLELEQQTCDYYDQLKQTAQSELFHQLQHGSYKRISRLARIRQELVTEMILEPITGIDSDKYKIDIAPESDEVDIFNQAILLEGNLDDFYSQVSPLIPMKEVARAFLRMAEENEKRITSIKNYLTHR